METILNSLTDTFSERYRAQVEAERQYVRSTGRRRPTGTDGGGYDPEAVLPDPGCRQGAQGSIEDAFRSVRSENRTALPASAAGKPL